MITILTPLRAFTFRVDEWGRDDDRDVHVYTEGTTLATFDADSVVAIFQDLSPESHASLTDALNVDITPTIDPKNQNDDETTTTT